MWLADRSISKSFLCHHSVVLYSVYVFYVRTAPVRSQHVASRCTLCNSRPRLLPRLPLPIPTRLKLALLAQAPACSRLRPRCCCCCCRPASVGTPYERRQNGWLHAETAGDYKRRCRIVTKQDLTRSLIVQHVQFFSWTDECSIRCDLFNLVPRCQVSRCTPLQYGAALSSLVMSVPTILMVSRCQVSRFQSPHWKFERGFSKMVGSSRSEYASTWHIIKTSERSQILWHSAMENLVYGSQKPRRRRFPANRLQIPHWLEFEHLKYSEVWPAMMSLVYISFQEDRTRSMTR